MSDVVPKILYDELRQEMSELRQEMSLKEERFREITYKYSEKIGDLNYQLTTYKKKYLSFVTPHVVGSWIELIEDMCGFGFPYEAAKYVGLTKNERSRKIREDKWLYMLKNTRDDSLLEPIVDLIEPTKYHKFCKDISCLYSIIFNEIRGAKFENPDDLPTVYHLLAHKNLKYAIDIVMCTFQNETNS